MVYYEKCNALSLVLVVDTPPQKFLHPFSPCHLPLSSAKYPGCSLSVVIPNADAVRSVTQKTAKDGHVI